MRGGVFGKRPCSDRWEFGEGSRYFISNILEQMKTKFPLRVEIDEAVLGVLGFGDDEINRILDHLYPALANEIQQHRAMSALLFLSKRRFQLPYTLHLISITYKSATNSCFLLV